MQSKAVTVLLMLLMNTAQGLLTFAAFKQGSPGFIVCSVVGFVVTNMLAFLGAPIAAKAQGWTIEEPKKAILPGEIAKFAFLPVLFAGALLVSGCAFGRCELGRLSSIGQVGFATAQKIAGDPGSTSADLVNAALQLAPGQLECGAQALLDWLDKSEGRKASLSPDHARSVLRAYLAGKTLACAPVRVAELAPCADSAACRQVVVDEDMPERVR